MLMLLGTTGPTLTQDTDKDSLGSPVLELTTENLAALHRQFAYLCMV